MINNYDVIDIGEKEKKSFEEKLQNNGFAVENEYSDEKLGLKLYHNKKLRQPIFIINEYNTIDPGKQEGLILKKINEFQKTIPYDKKTIGVILDMKGASIIDTLNEPYYFMKVPISLADLIPLKKENKRLTIINNVRTDKGRYDYIVNPYVSIVENLFGILKVIKDNEDKREIVIFNPVISYSISLYYAYMLKNYYDCKLKEW
jgi:hypothetical protein